MTTPPQYPPIIYNVQREAYGRKFFYQLLFFMITTTVGVLLAMYSPVANMLMSPEERDQLTTSREALKKLTMHGMVKPSVASSLTLHELQIVSKLVNPQDLNQGMDDIGGLVEIKKAVQNSIVIPLRYHEHFLGNNPLFPKPCRGVLFAGASGCGKTMLARAIAKESGVHFISLSLTDLQNKYHGESERLMSAAFSLARKIAPCILFIDEFDGLMRSRNSLDASHVYGEKTLFLSLMDGLNDEQSAVMVIGCTNNPSEIDPAMRRRMPMVIQFKLPLLDERVAILLRMTAQDNVQLDDIAYVAKLTDGYSGSDLESVYRDACMVRMANLVQKERHDIRLLRSDWDSGLESTAASKDLHRSNHLNNL